VRNFGHKADILYSMKADAAFTYLIFFNVNEKNCFSILIKIEKIKGKINLSKFSSLNAASD